MLDTAPRCIAVSETWLNSGSTLGAIQFPNYTFISKYSPQCG